MELLLGLLALVIITALILAPVSFFSARQANSAVAKANNRIADLEARIALLEARPAADAAQALAPEPETLVAPDVAAPQSAEPIAEDAREGATDAVQENIIPTAPETAKPPRRSLEEALGARWSVIVGGVALALGALLLVRYSIEQGFFGPAMRVAMGFALAVALIGAGEFMRRRERTSEAEPQETGRPDVPAILTAAGTVAAFGSIYAAHALYGFIGPALAFAALAIIGVACMFASALHGPSLAALGLVGALGSPLLVSSSDPSPWPVAALAALSRPAPTGWR